ncbi:hypothetical protein KCP71_02845 [Salmonella enterica subsp. enterica]|nr:hypothetical protein KCP71_02845 [Salmonella enterica subsp. enterica]
MNTARHNGISAPGKPTLVINPFIESFNGSLRDEYLVNIHSVPVTAKMRRKNSTTGAGNTNR